MGLECVCMWRMYIKVCTNVPIDLLLLNSVVEASKFTCKISKS